MDDEPSMLLCLFVAQGEEAVDDEEAARLRAELDELRRDAALGALVRRLGHAALVRTPLLGWRVDAFTPGPQGRTWYAHSPDETPEGALAEHFRLLAARDGSLTTTTATHGYDGERLAALERKAAAWDAREEVRAALRRALPDLVFASRFAAPDNPIVGGTLAARLDRRGVRAVLVFLGEREADHA